jgi:CheY-like chemotaxis protein
MSTLTTPKTAQKTVLFVDDDPDFVREQTRALEQAGFVVMTADGQEEAERLLERQRPDLVVCDQMLEHVDGGFILCHHLRQRLPDVPVILLTAVTSDSRVKFEANSPGERSWIKADVLLAKPLRFEQLRREIDRLLAETD